MKKILTDYVYPPIPIRWMDWVAYFDGQDGDGPHAFGASKEEAIQNLIDDGEEGEEYEY